MSTKVSQMPEASEITENDYLMVVQNGQNKKIKASMFQQNDEPAANAEKLEGHTADEFIKAEDTAYDSDRLGGQEASLYATKQYVDSKAANANGWDWFLPKPWIAKGKFPNNETPNSSGVSTHFAYCNGQWLDKDLYSELFALIGYEFSQVKSGQTFQLPDLRGRFLFGAMMLGSKTTKNLPPNLYSGDDFDSLGQWKYPQEIGKTGGDPTTTQDSTGQMAQHIHNSTHKQYELSQVQVAEGETGGVMVAKIDQTYSNDPTTSMGYNTTGKAVYPPNEQPNPRNQAMMSIPPYFTVAYIMQIKPF